MDKSDSTDYWYTFLNSLKNKGLSSGSGLSEIDEETQENILNYLKEKIEEGVTDGETTLPPCLHDYFWRFPKEMLPKLRTLAESYLDVDPEHGAATVILAIVAYAEDNSEVHSIVKSAMTLMPKDPCMSLTVIDVYRCWRDALSDRLDMQKSVLQMFENLYEWGKHQEDTARYQDAKSTLEWVGVTPYSVYTDIKNDMDEYCSDDDKAQSTEQESVKIEEYRTLLKKCRELAALQQGTFQNDVLQKQEKQLETLKVSSEGVDFWDAFLDTLEDRGLSGPRWKLTPKVQQSLLKYFNTRISEGVVDGRTTLPSELPEYISQFPQAMLLELREYAEDILEKEDGQGAAAKMLAIIVDKSKYPYLERAIELLKNDPEVCFLAVKKYSRPYSGLDNALFERTLSTLEMMFERAQHQSLSELYHWLKKLYAEVGRTPCHIYRILMQCPEGNSELIDRCKPLILYSEQAFKKRLEDAPDDWYALRGLGDVYETLGETELADKYPWEPHPKFRWAKAAWVGRQLPDFSATSFDGKQISYADYRGKLLLLNFCAKWCGFCAPEIPYVKQAYEQNHKNGFEVIGISLDENEKDLQEYIQEHEIPWIQIYDGKVWDTELAQLLGINGVPSQWLIGQDGKIISVDTRQARIVHLVNWTISASVGNTVPDFSAVDIDGKPITPSSFRGKVVFLYFGATEQVKTYIDKINQKYNMKGFEVIGVSVNIWSDEAAYQDRVREKNFLGKHIYDGVALDGPLARKFGLDVWRELPAMVLIDKDGKVIASQYGHVHSPDAWTARLEKLIDTNLQDC